MESKNLVLITLYLALHTKFTNKKFFLQWSKLVLLDLE